MLKHEITQLLEQAVLEAQQKGLFPPIALPQVTVEHPQNVAHGDYASSLPLKLARVVRANPLAIAEGLARFITTIPEIEKIDVAPPGFINFTLNNNWVTRQVESILSAREAYGNIDLGRGSRVQLEFVSVNPTGPLHVGHGRGAVLGSTLANVLTAAGYVAEREYYVNDAGAQIDAFSRSLYARYCQVLGTPHDLPSDGYHGSYVMELAREVVTENGDSLLSLPPEDAIAELGKIGLNKMLNSIKAELELLGVKFDVWFSERSLYDGGQYQRAMSEFKRKGYIAEKEGALWFASSALGEDKDNVLVRSNGTPTYFASDIAYHYNKFIERKFDNVINIWGADHQGHVPRMKAAVSALGIEPDRLHIIITQMVTLQQGGVELRISKRSGDIITLREVVEEVGRDACRFFFLSRAASSQVDFDLELAKKQSMDNPVYYIQYAHARISSILHLAQERGINYSHGDVSLLASEPELALIRKMTQLPEVIEAVAHKLEPNYLLYYAQDLAIAFHSFYERCRVISKEKALTEARLKLVEAARIVFAKTLSLMDMTAPEKM
jgi:arginyl-tRNA synthetase